MLQARGDIDDTEFFIMGDWNFVKDKADRSPQHDDDLGVTNEMNKLKTSLDLLDGWRTSNPSSRSFTWEGTFGNERKKIFSRIDCIYTTRDTWEITNKYKTINCDFSDHDGVTVTVREASVAETGNGEVKLNRNIMRHPLFEKEADRLLYKLERKLNKYSWLEGRKQRPGKEAALQKLRDQYSPQVLWNKYKKDILEASTQVTQIQCKEITELRRRAEKEIKKAERDLRYCTPEREEEYRHTLSNQKKMMSNYNEEARNNRKFLMEAKWFKDTETMTKRWFGLNKP